MNSDIVVQWMFKEGAIETPVSMNSGVTSVEESGITRFVPQTDWRPMTAAEHEAIIATRSYPIPEAVTIVKFDDTICKSFSQSSAAAACIPGNTVGSVERRDALMKFSESLRYELPSVGLWAKSIRSVDVQITPSGAQSTAYDHANNRYIGLHIDNHDKLQLEKRREAFHLLAINFGDSERHFQFVNLGASAMATQLNAHIHNVDMRYKDVHQLTSEFLTTFPDYPVIRITLSPGYGYVAVTQSLLHDGATNNDGYADVAFLLAGRFSLIRPAETL